MAHDDTVTITTPTDREVVLTRRFDAPRSLVFEAMTTPELLKRWLRAPGRALEVCEVDLRVGGSFRYVFRGPGKRDVGMRGIFREVVAPERLVHVETWEDWDAGESTVATTLVERAGKTMLTTTARFPSKEVRDIVLKSGMERSAGENYDNLADVLTSMQAQ
jgi:uncharacterized protein YndB with AHSA1/START domain